MKTIDLVPGVKEDALQRIGKLLDSTQWAEGAYIEKSAELLSQRHRLAYVSMFNSCGSALNCIADYRAMTGRSGRVAIQANTFMASALVVLDESDLVVVDVNDTDYSMSLTSLQEAFKCCPFDTVVLTHVGGSIATEAQAISDWCKKQGLFLVEDGAHALGSSNPEAPEGNNQLGDYGDVAVTSFYATKAIPAGEGGALITRDVRIYNHSTLYQNYGKHVEAGKMEYLMSIKAGNYRMSEVQAVLVYLQLSRIDEIRELRIADALALCDALNLTPPVDAYTQNWYKFIVPDPKFTASLQVGKVYAESDQIQSVYPKALVPGNLCNAKRFAQQHLCLPIGLYSYKGMSSDQILQYLGVVYDEDT
ncbi:MAG: DegT/DnrJ/EryC1/StrS family aminotransferase [Gammaproteobacteria bacterium]|nr:DegT/DnrJ/EryC1/StrS family aminotransferase [Gammaproteobacteria bacterium]